MLIVTGAGENAFSAGVVVADHTKDKVSAMIETFHGNIKRVLAMPIPTVAEIIGTWGCPPKYYADVLRMCIEGKIALEPFVEIRPMSQIDKALHDAHHGQLSKRVILAPDF